MKMAGRDIIDLWIPNATLTRWEFFARIPRARALKPGFTYVEDAYVPADVRAQALDDNGSLSLPFAALEPFLMEWTGT